MRANERSKRPKWPIKNVIVSDKKRPLRLVLLIIASLVRAFAHSLVHKFACLLVREFAHSLVRIFARSLMYTFSCLLVHAFTRSLMCTHLLVCTLCSFVRTFSLSAFKFPPCMHQYPQSYTFLVADTRLYKPLCWSVGPLVGRSVRYKVTFRGFPLLSTRPLLMLPCIRPC